MGRCARLIPAIVFTALLAACGENALDGTPVFADLPRMSGDGGYAVGTNGEDGGEDGEGGTVVTPDPDDGESRGGDGGYAVGTNGTEGEEDGDGETVGGN